MPKELLTKELVLETDQLAPEMNPLLQRTNLFFEEFTRSKVVPLLIEGPQKPARTSWIFETQHGFYPVFDPAMILFKFIV